MKVSHESWIVLDADQRASRRGPDRVAEALDRLADVRGLRLPFERTAGDEIQCLTREPEAVLEALDRLTRLDVEHGEDHGWRLGLGVGPVESLDAVTSTREARGAAYVAAREAVDRAGQAPARLALVGGGEAGARAESALIVLRALLARRTEKGWEAVDAMAAASAKQSDVAVTLGLSESAVSQRLDRALWREVRHARGLAHHHLAAMLGEGSA